MSGLIQRSIRRNGRFSSMKLEAEFWSALSEIILRERCDEDELLTHISQQGEDGATSTLKTRVFILRYFRVAATEVGHRLAHHGTLDSSQTDDPGE